MKKTAKKPVAKQNFNSLTRKTLEAEGWQVELVEWRDRFGYLHDFMGFADFVICRAEPRRTVAVQVTSKENRSARIKKIIAEKRAYGWLRAGNGIWVMTWDCRKEQEVNSKGELVGRDIWLYDVLPITESAFVLAA